MYIETRWTDYKLRWDPYEYGGFDKLRLPSEHVWTPSFALPNCETTDVQSTPVRADSNGTVLWLQEMTFGGFCSLLSKVEKQKCVIVLQTSAVDTTEVAFKVSTYGNSDFNITDPFREWKATDFSVEAILRQVPNSGFYFNELYYSFKIENQMAHSGGHSFRNLLNITICCLCLLVYKGHT